MDVWTVDRVEILCIKWAEGYSCKDIAGILGGVTRNAVIGKVHRLNLPTPKVKRFDPYVDRQWHVRKSPEPRKEPKPEHRPIIRIVRANGNSDRRRVFISVATDMPELRCVEIEPLNKALMDLEKNDCRYPYGDGPMVFCGHPKMDGSAYCVPHHHLCWAPPKVLTDKAPVREVA